MRQAHITAVENGYIVATQGFGPMQTPAGVLYEPPRNMVARSIEEAFALARTMLTGEGAAVPEAFREKEDA